MNVKTIQKYRCKSIAQLQKKATLYFNQFIRMRDKGKGCVSCDSRDTDHASHFYSAGKYPPLKYDEKNVHASCVQCNYFLHGNLIEYRKRIIQRISKEDLSVLDYKVKVYNKYGHKWNRWQLIDIIETYKNKCELVNFE